MRTLGLCENVEIGLLIVFAAILSRFVLLYSPLAPCCNLCGVPVVQFFRVLAFINILRFPLNLLGQALK